MSQAFRLILRRPIAIATFLAIWAAIGINFWSNRFPPQGKTIADLANTTYADTLFIPANYAFAIWGIIYLGLIGFGLYQLSLPNNRYGFVFQARPWLILACGLQSLWVYTFVQQFLVMSTVVMVALLLTLIKCYNTLQVGQRRLSRRDRWLLHHPFSLYLAWISVATIVNVAITLKQQGWHAWGISEPIWTVVMMAIAATHAIAVLRQRGDQLYGVVVLWAVLALVVRYITLGAIAVSGLILGLGLLGYLLIWRRKSSFSTRINRSQYL